MNKTIISLSLAAFVFVGWRWSVTETPHLPAPILTAQESAASAAEIRHKHAEPTHWRALFLHQQ